MQAGVDGIGTEDVGRRAVLRCALNALNAEAHHLTRLPGLTFPQLHNQLRDAYAEWPDVGRWCAASARTYARTWLRRTSRDQTRARNQLATLAGHEDVVHGCRFSPDGRLLASVCLSGTLRVWDVATGRELACLTSDGKSLRDCCWSPDGERVAVVGDTAELRIWDWAAARVTSTIDVTDRTVEPNPRSLFFVCCDWSPDGTGVLCGFGTWTYQAALWDPTTGTRLWTLPCATHVDACAFSPDGSLAAVIGDSRLCVYSIPPSRWRRPKPRFERRLRTGGKACGFSRDGRRLVYATGDEVGIIDLHDGSETRMECHGTCDAALSPDGETLLVAGGYRMSHGAGVAEAGAYTARSMERVAELTGHQDMILTCDWSPDGRLAATGSRDGTLKIWRPSIRVRGESHAHPFGVGGLAWHPGGSRVLSVGRDGRAHFWDAESGEWRTTVTGRDTPTSPTLSDGDYAPDGSAVVLGVEDGTLEVVDAATLGVRWSVRADQRAVLSCAWSPGGDRIASSGTTGVAVWNADNGERLLYREQGGCTRLRFSPDGRRLAVHSPSTLEFVDADKLQPTYRVHVIFDDRHELAWSPDGSSIVIGDYDQSLVVVDAKAGVPLRRLPGHLGAALPSSNYSGRYGSNAEVLCGFVGDHRVVVTAYVDGRIRIWDVRSGVLLTEVATDAAFRCLAVAGRRICLGDDQGHLHWFSLENVESGLAAVLPARWVRQELCPRCRSDFLEPVTLEDGRPLRRCRHCRWAREPQEGDAIGR